LRCQHTGEFIHKNTDNEWMPESCLFDTESLAQKELSRIKRLITKWIDGQ